MLLSILSSSTASFLTCELGEFVFFSCSFAVVEHLAYYRYSLATMLAYSYTFI